MIWPIYLFGQVSFQADHRLFGGSDVFSQVPIAVVDVNNDLLDDVVTLDRGNHLKVYYQTQNTLAYFERDYGLVSPSVQLALNVGDLDNDGWKEILVGGFYDGVKVYKAFPNSSDFLQFRKTSTDFFTQNISLVDLNENGLLDLYVNDDDNVPKVFQNVDGEDLVPSQVFDFPHLGEAASGNYGSVFTDFDRDGDLDLYISKCRLGVDDASDPRRINQLWLNDGLGSFTESASLYDLASGEQTWVTDFVDLDNDGDLDVVMLNHTGGNLILENNDGNYEKKSIGQEWSEIFEGLQLLVRDFDNDGYKDIMIAGFESKMFWNKGDFEFEEDKNFLENRRALSAAVGDLNNDGFWDLYCSYAEGLFENSLYGNDEILLNTSKQNNFIKLTLKGSESNRDAIGALVELYGEWGIQTYEIRSGESYGIVNSNSLVLGLGSEVNYDSLIVHWPMGKISKHMDLRLNEHHILNENGCIGAPIALDLPMSNVICNDSSVLLTAPEASFYYWSSGSEEKTLGVYKSGLYNVQITDSNACVYPTSSVYLEDFDEIAKPEIKVFDPYASFCPSDAITLTTQYNSVLWNNELESSALYAIASDTIYAALSVCDTLWSDDFIVQTVAVQRPITLNDTIELGEDAIFMAEGQDLRWYESLISDEVIGQGTSFTIEDLDVDSTLFVASLASSIGRDTIQTRIESGISGYPPNNINGGLVFSVNDHHTTLESVTCFTDVEAVRKIQVKDYWGNIVHEKEVLISPMDSVIKLNFFLPVSNYYILTTDANTNLLNMGHVSPRLTRHTLGEDIYEFNSDKGNVNIISSTGGLSIYYSFYDWELLDYELECESERVAVEVHVNQTSMVNNMLSDQLIISPNPFHDKINFKGIVDLKDEVVVLDIMGRHISSRKLRETMDFSFLLSGTYFFKIGNTITKLVKL